MEIALALGQSQEALSHSMSEREFRAWGRYAEQHGFPARRVELYLAQIAWLIAITFGGAKEVELSDFLFDRKISGDTEQQEKEDPLEVAKRSFGFNPRIRKS